MVAMMLLELSVMLVKSNCSKMHVIDFLGVSDLDDGCENGAIRLADGNATAGRVSSKGPCWLNLW